MIPEIRDALDVDMIVDITTRGRNSGRPRRIEIWSHYFDGNVIVAGSPSVARRIRDTAERRAVLTRLVELSKFRQEQGVKDIEVRVAGSPLVEVIFEDRP